MEYRSHFILMAEYSQFMNEQFFEVAAKLTEDQLSVDRGAFFGSILGTFNHILVGDLIWLSRFSTHSDRFKSLIAVQGLPHPKSLNQVIYPNLELLKPIRVQVDAAIKHWLAYEIEEGDFSRTLVYKSTTGIESERDFGELVYHLFNHQTHHRGQVSTLLNQAGVDVGITDYLHNIPELKGNG